MNSWFEKLYDTFIVDNNYKLLLEGFGNTILITLSALLIGVVIGSIIAIAKYYAEGNKKLQFISWICDIYTTVIRGIPVTVLLMIFYFIIIISDTEGITTAIIAFGINSGAYVAEIIRGGIMSIDKGQTEAGRSLGLSKAQTMIYIVIPQAIKNVLPPIGNEFIVLLKETAIVGYVSLTDLTRAANQITSRTYEAFMPLIGAAVIYFTIIKILTVLLEKLERRLRKSDNR